MRAGQFGWNFDGLTCRAHGLEDDPHTIRMPKSIQRMLQFQLFTLALSVLVGFAPFRASAAPSQDWPSWRGPNRNGIAQDGQNPPVQWSETENIVWKAAIPGRGHSSPTVVGDRVYLATSDPVRLSQSVLCLDRKTGKQIWLSEVHPSGGDPGKQSHSSAASSTVSYDAGQLFISFLNGGAIYTSCLNRDGKLKWQQKICSFVTHQGFAASPVVYGSRVIVSADHKGGGVITALNRRTGASIWTESRPKIPNYTTPAILEVAGRTQMVLAGCNLVSSFDPLTGKKLWEIAGSTEECVGSAVTDGKRVFVGGGYPKNHTMAVEADGSGRIAWQNTARVYVPSMIAKDGFLYAVMDAGLAVCWKSDTGEEVWKERLGGDFFASPILVNNRIYASNVGGKTFVFEASPSAFKLIGTNQLGNEAYASPVICGSRVYLRVAVKGDPRQEFLYCVGK